MADQLAGEAEAFAETISNEMGKTIREARNEVRRAQNTLRLSGDAAVTLHGEIIPCAIVAVAPDKQPTSPINRSA
ncbi:aldehyde dehydrogenase family protein [Mesorhizobium sp. M0751]|uniref:aldehyde dehydrogenase family protein n=1 Tax=Mesorhizobium sp. M0894 TaxID=2957018 RepID=UPI003337BAFB